MSTTLQSSLTSSRRASWTVRARSLLASASMATLTTKGPQTVATTPVPLVGGGEALPVVCLGPSSPAVPGLAECRVATLCVQAPDSEWGLRLVVSFRMRRPDDSGLRSYEPTLLSVRVTGAHQRTIPVAEFLRTTPDPESARDEATLRHLARVHAADLVIHVRALGHPADAVVPVGLRDAGVDLSLLTEDGVATVWLDEVPAVCACW